MIDLNDQDKEVEHYEALHAGQGVNEIKLVVSGFRNITDENYKSWQRVLANKSTWDILIPPCVYQLGGGNNDIYDNTCSYAQGDSDDDDSDDKSSSEAAIGFGLYFLLFAFIGVSLALLTRIKKIKREAK